MSLCLQAFLPGKAKDLLYKYVKELTGSTHFHETDLMNFESFAQGFRCGYTLNHLLHDPPPARGPTHPPTAHSLPHLPTRPRARTPQGTYDNELILNWLQQGQRAFDVEVDPSQMSWEELDAEYKAMATDLGFDAARWDNDTTDFLGKW